MQLFSLLLSLFAGQLPPYQKLCAQLKDISGWKVEKCEGTNMTGSPMAYRSYNKGNKHVEAAIFCGMQQAMGYWAPFAYHMQVDSTEEFMKTTTINGFPVGIGYHKKDKTGGIIVCLDKNAQQHRAVFVLNFRNMSWEEALEIAKKFDWKAMEKLLR
ncbi:MAG: hypothetical protein J7M03_03865 [Candidatus Desulfofervidaceae bacterium]|nr:hypothetical protein [Candidatus Desulfofervidaceae bacterium]